VISFATSAKDLRTSAEDLRTSAEDLRTRAEDLRTCAEDLRTSAERPVDEPLLRAFKESRSGNLDSRLQRDGRQKHS